MVSDISMRLTESGDRQTLLGRLWGFLRNPETWNFFNFLGTAVHVYHGFGAAQCYVIISRL
jgi:hypothetical protein